MLKKIGLIIALIILALFGWAAIQPSDYKIAREITINAPVEKIFPYLNNSVLAEQWGPWMEIDPGTKMIHSGPDSGVGSKTSWEGGKNLGTGSATIVESVNNERVGIALEYTKPMQMTQHSDYLVRSSGSQSIVTWRVEGKNTFMGRLMCVFFNMDKMVGGMFEKGLQNLKRIIEKP